MSDQNMIERVAMALAPSAFTGKFLSKHAQSAEQTKALASARIVLTAMREPTPALLDAMMAAESATRDNTAIWNAAIDAALEDGR